MVHLEGRLQRPQPGGCDPVNPSQPDPVSARGRAEHRGLRLAAAATFALLALTPGTGCMRLAPDAALSDFSCRMDSLSSLTTQSIAAGRVAVRFKVANLSKAGWPAGLPGEMLQHPVTFGSHWISGATLLDGGPRARLFEDLEAGGSVTMEQEIDPPPAPGRYLLRIQPVQENIAWFADAGGCKLEFPVEVTP